MDDSSIRNVGGSGNINCGNAENSYNSTWNNYNIAFSDRKPEILEWLSSLEPQGNQQGKRHQDVRYNRVSGIGDWLLETDEFLKWRDCEDGSVNPTLFCCGGPGVGKTYLSSLVIDRLSDATREGTVPVVYLYCDFQAEKPQATSRMLASLLKQVVCGLEVIPEEIDRAFQMAKPGSDGRGLSVPETLRLLPAALRSYKRVFICIDALDECVTEQRPEFLRALRSIVRDSPGVRLFATGRPHIQAELEKHHSGTLQIMTFKPVKGDIRIYLEMKLQDDSFPKAMDSELKRGIMKVIPEMISEIFLLVSLNIKAILRETTLSKRKEKLKQVTSGLGLEGAYTDTLKRIQEQDKNRSKLAMQALMWISQSERPLRVDELCHALAVEIGSTHFDPDNVPSIHTILSCSLGLIAADEEASIVRPIHFTLQEYLREHSTLFSSPHGTIAEVCLTYLNLQPAENPSSPSPGRTTEAPLLEYASHYWGTHARMETTATGKSLALKLLGQYDTHISATLLLSKICREEGVPWDGDGPQSVGFTGLHAVAFFGNTNMVASLLKIKDSDPNRKDSRGRSPLTWAAMMGNLGVVEILLGVKGVGVREKDNRGRTPLSWAAGKGHLEIVRVLLRKAPDAFRIRDNNRRRPLLWAAESGKEAIVDTLLKKDADIDWADNIGETALIRAAANGHQGVVKILLQQKKVNPDIADGDGRTPLSLAAGGGFEGVVSLLLARSGVNPNTADSLYGRTPLSWAAGNGHETVTKLLLAHSGIDLGLADERGWTPHSWAIQFGHAKVIKMLLNQTELDSSAQFIDGQTPISWATGHWCGESCVSRLEAAGLSTDLPDRNGRTLLSWAAGCGNVDFVEYLLKRKDVNPNLADKYGRTALSWAVTNGSHGAVQLLLKRDDVDPNLADKDNRTSLSWGMARCGLGALQLLLKRTDIDPNSADKDGRTPLSRAAAGWNRRAVELLLERADVDPNLVDKNGRTPLSWAAGNWGAEGLVRPLLGRADVDPNLADKDGRSPLSWAAEKGGYRTLGLLLERPDVDPNLTDKDGRSPLSWAAGDYASSVLAGLILKRADVDPNLADKDGRTPLSWAAATGHQGAVQDLLTRADPSIADNKSHTPLSWATRNRHPRAAVRILRHRSRTIFETTRRPGHPG